MIGCANVQFRVYKLVSGWKADTTLPIYRDFKNTNVSVATKKSQSVAHTCGKRMELDWRTGSLH
jgi:hypothetical protein